MLKTSPCYRIRAGADGGSWKAHGPAPSDADQADEREDEEGPGSFLQARTPRARGLVEAHEAAERVLGSLPGLPEERGDVVLGILSAFDAGLRTKPQQEK